MLGIYWLSPTQAPDDFPDPMFALEDPNGLLAAGGDLSEARLIAAYRRGIFPWYSDGEPILWWSPDPRAVLFPNRFKISRSLKKTLKKGHIQVSMDKAFSDVINACSKPRKDGLGTWITAELKDAYCHLHEIGVAHSIECWHENRLVGGLYGVALGKIFFGESMFSTMPDASKVALAYLVRQLQRWEFAMIDCQVSSDHLATLGSMNIPRTQFVSLIAHWRDQPSHRGAWRFDDDIAW